VTKTPIENCRPPLTDSGHQRLGHRLVPRTSDDDPARVAVIDRLCHPITQQVIRDEALRREIVLLTDEYRQVDGAWLMAQLQAWELECTSSADLTRRRGIAVVLENRKAEILRKLRDKSHALGTRMRK